MYFSEFFLLPPFKCIQFCLNFVAYFAYTVVIGLVITSACCFQYYNKFIVAQNKRGSTSIC